jgi:hypothetical protein
VPLRTARFLLVLDDIQRMDRLAQELSDLGMEALTAFSTSEGMALAFDDPPDVALIDAALDGADDLSAWIQRKYRTAVCFVHEFDEHRGPPWARPPEPGEALPEDADSDELVATLLSALANVRAAQLRAGLA